MAPETTKGQYQEMPRFFHQHKTINGYFMRWFPVGIKITLQPNEKDTGSSNCIVNHDTSTYHIFIPLLKQSGTYINLLRT